VSYNVAPRLRRCLASLAGCEVIVVDNTSTDDSADMVRNEFPAATLVVQPENGGFSRAVNEGARRATGDLLLILNPDTVLPTQGLAQIEQRMAARPDAWAMGFRQVDASGRFQLSIGPPPSLVLELGRRFVQRRLDAGSTLVRRLLERLLSRPRRVPWVSGAALLVRKDAFTRVAGFDERFFLYFEDIDFCLRLRAAGGAVYYDPSITICHEGGASARTRAAASARAYRDSQLYFWGKHRGPWVRRLVLGYLKLRGLAPASGAR
jgi:N-acetylglucosaminyl-diphospho-decaprenol L-rhamnosyltransferase